MGPSYEAMLGTHVQKHSSTYNDAMKSIIKWRKKKNLMGKTLLQKDR